MRHSLSIHSGEILTTALTFLCLVTSPVAASRVNLTEWQRLSNSQANASASVRFPGPNISAPYPGDGSTAEGWNISLRIVADVPVDGMDAPSFTGTQLTMEPPDSLITDNGTTVHADKTWKTCLSVFKMSKLTISSTDNNETCDGVLSDKCVLALQEAAKMQDCTSLPSLPDACGDKYGLASIVGRTQDFGRENGTHYPMGGVLLGYGVESHEKGNFSAYDDALHQMYVVIAAFGANNTQEESDRRPPGSLRCVWPSGFGVNSRTLEDSSAGMALATGLVVWIVPLAASMLLTLVL